MDDDVFFDDAQVDTVALERRLADNELKKQAQVLWDKGYLDGLEIAETFFRQFDLGENPDARQAFAEGVTEAQEATEKGAGALMAEAGALK